MRGRGRDKHGEGQEGDRRRDIWLLSMALHRKRDVFHLNEDPPRMVQTLFIP